MTQILRSWSDGDKAAPERLIPIVYQELRRLAGSYLRRERNDHTLQPTALVHEAYLKLVGQDRTNWKDRAHFCRIAAQIMRRILLQHARDKSAEKRGGGMHKLYLDETKELASECRPDLIALDDALRRFAKNHPREAEVVELRFFGGLNTEEIAEALSVSSKTVLRDWIFARTWLCRELTR